MLNLISTSSFSYPKGYERENEDSILSPLMVSDGYLFAVADGVGSYAGAKQASMAAIQTLSQQNMHRVDHVFQDIREQIRHMCFEDKSISKASTTLTFCYANERGIQIGHIGDCRLYVTSGKKLIQLTKDDTQHQKLIDEKIFTAKFLKDKPGKNILTTAIATHVKMEYDDIFMSYSELPNDNGVISLHIMSDGAHHLWEKRPRLSENTMKSTSKFTASLLRRIERIGPIDDYSIVSASFAIPGH